MKLKKLFQSLLNGYHVCILFSLLGLIRGTSAMPVRRSYGNARRYKPAGRTNSCTHLAFANQGVKRTLNDAKGHSATKSRTARTDKREPQKPHRREGKSSDGFDGKFRSDPRFGPIYAKLLAGRQAEPGVATRS